MPNVSITIPTPVLTGSDYFKVRYRLISGGFGPYQNEDNDPFTLIGLAAGQYELEVIMVKDGVECPASLHPFTVTDPYTCVTFTPVMVQNGNLFNLQISYPAHTTPPCGWHIEITGATTNKIVNYASLPASPLLIPVANEGLAVKVKADLCNGKIQECLNTDVPAIAATCTPMVITGVTGSVNNTYPNGDYGVNISFSYTQSSPPTQWLTILINQKNATIGPNGTTSYPNFSFGPIATTGTGPVSVPIIANHNITGITLEFDWLIIDGCNQQHTGTVNVII